jgi:hypothetical protein
MPTPRLPRKLQPPIEKSMANRAFRAANDMPGASVEQGPGAKKAVILPQESEKWCKSLSDKGSWLFPQ